VKPRQLVIGLTLGVLLVMPLMLTGCAATAPARPAALTGESGAEQPKSTSPHKHSQHTIKGQHVVRPAEH